MANKKVLHKRSSVTGTEPTADQLDYGEIAINFADKDEKIFIKNSENNIVAFIPKRAFTEAPIADTTAYLLGVKSNELVRVEMPYLTVAEGDIVLDYLGTPIEVEVQSNTRWEIV